MKVGDSVNVNAKDDEDDAESILKDMSPPTYCITDCQTKSKMFKNAVTYLFPEVEGKPAVVSGQRGGSG